MYVWLHYMWCISAVTWYVITAAYLPLPRRYCRPNRLFRASVCLSTCLHVCFDRISPTFVNGFLMKFFGWKNRLDFGGDPDTLMDRGSFLRTRHHGELGHSTIVKHPCSWSWLSPVVFVGSLSSLSFLTKSKSHFDVHSIYMHVLFSICDIKSHHNYSEVEVKVPGQNRRGENLKIFHL